MVISWYHIGWITLSLFQVGISIHFFHLFKIDKDKRKLMFGIAYLTTIFSVLYAGFSQTSTEINVLHNIYYWSFLTIIISISLLGHSILFDLKKEDLIYKIFIWYLFFSFIFLVLLPYPAEILLSPVVIFIGTEILIISVILFITRRKITNFLFFMAVFSFMVAGISTAQDLQQYFQIFSYLIGYIFILLIFAYPKTSETHTDGMGAIFALKKKLDDTEKNLQETSERYRDLFEHIKSGVAVYSAVDKGSDFVFTDFNKAAENIENISRDNVIGNRVTEVFPSVKDFGLFEVFKEVWKTGIPKRYPVSFYSDGRLTGWRDTTVYKLSSDEIVAVYDDVTKEKQQELELQYAHENLKKLNKELDKKVEQRTAQVNHLLKQKDDFINQLGHDLKNPLGPFITLLPILRKHVSNKKDKRMVEVLDRNARYMQNLVKKTIELAKLNSDKTVFNFEYITLAAIVDDVLFSNTSLFDEHEITVDNRIPSDLRVEIDTVHIMEVFSNIFTNAVKYSEGPGNIIVDAKEKDNYLIVSVEDTGIGISSDQIEYLFDEYYKTDESRHDFESSGLGLPICKSIVEKHGGHIWAESKGLGKGSTFYFTLPLRQQKNYIMFT